MPAETLFDRADELAIQVPTSCGRSGRCHECIVEVKQGMEALSARTEAEDFLRGSFRLACQAEILDRAAGIQFSPLQRRPQILTSTAAAEVEIDALVTRSGRQVLYDGAPVDEFRGHLYGVAIDLGTTTIVMELVDLETGEVRAGAALENPQRFGGSDVMHRISYDAGKFQGELHKAAVNAVNLELRELSRRFGFDRHEIYELVVAGNSTMRDLFFNLDVQSIGQRPYRSLTEQEWLDRTRPGTSLVEYAHRLGIWAHPKARVWSPPLVASHVGADTTAALVAIGMERQREVVMLVDIGTNTEVVVGNGESMIAASCPAGPAFEGGLVKYGMTGSEGAIESVRLRGGRFECRTIGGGEPQGICGSGLIDLLAELRRHGRMTPKGVFADRSYEFTLAPGAGGCPGITFSREDASHLAQAKSANYCGQFLVMREYGVSPAEITRLYLAGGFANFVDPASAVEIGFLAPVAAGRIVKAGNASLAGARRMLLSRGQRETAGRLVKRVRHLELETMPDFFEVFVEGCQFKPMPAVSPAGVAR